MVLREIPIGINKRKIAPAFFQEIRFRAFFERGAPNLGRYSVIEKTAASRSGLTERPRDARRSEAFRI